MNNKNSVLKKKKIVVGLSGGVDSSVTAALLQKQGFEVIGVFMKNWSGSDDSLCCSADEDLQDARIVAGELGIPFYVWNFEREYYARVVEYFLREYRRGRTPNPDVMCNSEIKFKVFLDQALALGADFVATGHYASVVKKNSAFHLLKGVDTNKDQSYFLYRLKQKQLAKVLFPLGRMTKPEVRKLAAKFGLHTQAKKDSQGICFIGKINVREFLRAQLPAKPGDIVDEAGKKLGRHDGLAFFTLGQREGLAIAAAGPWYVVDKNSKKNELVASRNTKSLLLWKQKFLINDLSWTDKAPKLPGRFEVVIRYHHTPYWATLKRSPSKVGGMNFIEAVFDEPQRAITPGQAAVIFRGEELLGGGNIDRVF